MKVSVKDSEPNKKNYEWINGNPKPINFFDFKIARCQNSTILIIIVYYGSTENRKRFGQSNKKLIIFSKQIE